MGTRDGRTLHSYVVAGCLNIKEAAWASALSVFLIRIGSVRSISEEDREAFVRGLDNEALIEFYELLLRDEAWEQFVEQDE